MHTRASGHKKKNKTLNPVESNHRDGPTGHNKTLLITVIEGQNE